MPGGGTYLMVFIHLLFVFLQMSPSLAKIYLRKNMWSTDDVIHQWQTAAINPRLSDRSPTSTSRSATTLRSSSSGVVCKAPLSSSSQASTGSRLCEVCATLQPSKNFSELLCGHSYCQSCWELHFEYQILQGLSTSKCDISMWQGVCSQFQQPTESGTRSVSRFG